LQKARDAEIAMVGVMHLRRDPVRWQDRAMG
jgi:hypothetical protein